MPTIVTLSSIIRRINRRSYTDWRRGDGDWVRVCKTRPRWISSLGDFHLVHPDRNLVVDTHLTPQSIVEIGRERGYVGAWEVLAEADE